MILSNSSQQKDIQPEEIQQEIRETLHRLGKSVTLVGHHYQHASVIEHCHKRGDSLELARMVSSIDCPHIVFCGVYFMGESAALLAKPGQHIYLPEDDAECVMALMSPTTLVDRLLARLSAKGRKVVPLAYVNSTLEVKAVVGRYGGGVCTSANAQKMLDWALTQGDAVLFLPDKNLARNTARTLGIMPEQQHILDIRKRGEAADMAAADTAKLIIWPGLCAIHARFHVRHVEEARATHPGCLVVVHPECHPSVVDAADIFGSTTTIIRAVREAKPGSVVCVGTEINLVQRLAVEQLHQEAKARNVRVLPLLHSACSHMAAVTPKKLLQTLQNIENGTAKPVQIRPHDAEPARLALERMLTVCN